MTGKTKRLWTPGEEALLRELYPNHRNSEIAKLMGRSITSVRLKGYSLRLVKSQGFRCANGLLWTDEEASYFVTHYADTDNKVIAAHLDRTPKAVLSMARRLGARKSDEYIYAAHARISREGHAAKSAEELAEWNKNSGAGLHRLYEQERRRAIFGLPQKTNIKVRIGENRRKDWYKQHLKSRNGYHVFPDMRSCVYYSDATQRSKRVEEYAERVYHLRILPLSDYHG